MYTNEYTKLIPKLKYFNFGSTQKIINGKPEYQKENGGHPS